MQSPSSSWLAAGVLLLVGLVLRVPRLTQSIWFDEAFRTFVVLKAENARSILLHDVHNPLYNACMYIWIRVFGDSELSIRTPVLLAGTAMIVIMWRWIRDRFGVAPAWWAAAFLTVNPVHIWYSCEAKNNMFTVLLVTLTLWRLDALSRTLTARDVTLATIAGALAIWTDFQSLLVLPAVWLAWTWIFARDPQRMRAWMVPLTAAAGSLLLASPLLVFKAQRLDDLDRHYLSYFHWYEPFRMLLVYFPTGNALVPTVRATWPFAALAFAPFVLPAFIWGIAKLRTAAHDRITLIVLCMPMLIMWIGSEIFVQSGSSVRIFQDRNVLVMLPAVAMVLAVGAYSLKTRAGVVLSRWGLLLLTLASSIALISWNREQRTVMYPNTHWRQAAAWIRTDAGSSQVLVVSRTPLLAMEYYMPADRVVHLPSRKPLEETLPTLIKNEALTAASEFYFIQHDYWSSFTEESLAWFDANFETLAMHNELHLSIRRVRPRSIPLPVSPAPLTPAPE
jgi:uncharacterized membrane protein